MNKKIALGALALILVMGVSGTALASKNAATKTDAEKVTVKKTEVVKTNSKKSATKSTVVGKITAIDGNNLTVTNKKTTYAIDAANAKISKGTGKKATTLTAADLKVGDQVKVTGTKTGTNIAAAKISVFSPSTKASATAKTKVKPTTTKTTVKKITTTTK